ncbi:YSIRK-type signal peptide-containing protein [Streptococcus didelphis]|uniref:YSIRK-type signal peptide-containing protein n=1 Tax=Streptococcus didelphis TaxID=102886 RepID=A0ABY9LGF1_9STRE|nr:YSIRK-type signal peptide-containing protein [Streptococcus didelphis]WMB27980.1 YSIRK-type signal peptide-containing protein [Streptococcus didelphis]
MKNIFNFLADPKKRYCIRKLSVGVCSILIGMSLFGAQEVEARQKPSSTEIEATSLVSQRENKEPLGESLANQGQNSQSVSHEASPSSELKANLVANDQAKSVTDGDEEAETVVKNILKGKRPTTNSDSLIESNSSTGPDLAIQNPSKATDGVKETGIDDKTNTKIIAGKETGGEDNGYASWKPVYLQYDFGKEVEVNSLNIYRNSYKNALSTFKKLR